MIDIIKKWHDRLLNKSCDNKQDYTPKDDIESTDNIRPFAKLIPIYIQKIT